MSDAEPTRGFDAREYASRLDRAQRKMAGQAMQGLLLTTEPEIRYFTGFQTQFWQSPTRPWFLFLPAAGKPVAIIPEIGAALMRRAGIDDIRTWSAPQPNDDGRSLLHDLLLPYARRRARIGVPKGHETVLRMPLGDYERLMHGLPGLELIDATRLIAGLRMVKSKAEIEKIAHICAVASGVFGAADNIFHEGQALSQSFREFKRALLAAGADDVSYLVGGAGPGGYEDIISPPTQAPLCAGDVLMLDTGSVWDGYFCDFDRNYAIGTADEKAKRAHETLHRATEAGLSAARPGISCRRLYEVMLAVTSEFDGQGGNVGRMGHGLGMQLTEWPSLAPFDDTVLVENMVITLEPSVAYGDGRMMVHEENIVIRDGAPQLLTTRTAPQLPVIK